MTISRTPKSQKKVAECVKLFEKTIELSKNLPTKSYATPDKPLPTTNNMIMARIQRDLNSPSAAARVKALRAMKSPTKSAYSHFDIPEAEQSLHLPEPPSLQEIMRNIVVYVEVRSGEDNRSAGVRKVIEALGARVNLSLLRDTTHVVFKDGLLSTFKKATQLGIPVVSILWIEACKNQRRICDPKDYPISNLDRYENPELYTKMKRTKYMQPDSECNKRVRAKAAAAGGAGTPKDTTPTQKTAGAIKKTSTLIGGTPTSSTNKKKTDISQFFKKLDRPTPIANSTIGGDAANSSTTIPESPATQLLNRINSECYTPLEQLKKTTKKKDNNIEIYDEESLEGFGQVGAGVANSPKPRINVKKALDFQQNVEKKTVSNVISPNKEKMVNTRRRRSSVVTTQQAVIEIDASVRVNIQQQVTPSTLKKTKPPRRHSLMPSGEIEIATNSLNSMAIYSTPSKNTRRRSSIHTSRDMTMNTPNRANRQPQILEEVMELDTMEEEKIEKPIAPEKPPRSINKRRTLFSVQAMDQTDVIKLDDNKTKETAKQPPTSATKTTRRRTTYGSKTMETSEMVKQDNNGITTINVTNRRRTCFSLKSIEQTEIQQSNLEKAPTPPNDHKLTNSNQSEEETAKINNNNEKNKQEFTNKVLDILNKIDVVAKMPAQTKDDKKPLRRRTLYTPQKVNNGKTTTLSAISPNVTNGICMTPTSFTHGNMACSTLLDDKANKPALVATPPADATTGKLLEETVECVTPIVFSSTRLPSNKRRTLFDVSMDIITQRLQCINQTARKSLAPPPTPLGEGGITTEVSSLNTPVELKKSKQLENLTNTPTSSMETLIDSNNDAVTGNVTPGVATLKKKRKLFMPNEMLLTPPPSVVETKKSVTESTPLTANGTSSVNKRRRTLMPISQPQPSTVTLKDSSSINTTPSVRKRRSTLDFEQIKNIKTKINNMDTNKKTQDLKVVAAPSSANIKESLAADKSKKMPVLVYTNMHKQQIDVIREATNKLGTFTLESCVTDSTTHLISLEPRRTLNLLRALVRGLWILEYSWLVDSLQAGKWLPEESYELRDFSRSIEICRSERQAFGEHYKCELFRKFGSFYISSQCAPITKDNLCELIRLCGGRVVPTRQKARYIIGDANCNLEDKFYLTPYWILDSITQMQVMKINNKYTYPLPGGEKPATQLMAFEKNIKT